MNVKIKAVDVYHPSTVVDNEYYLNHFREQGKEIAGLLRTFGREKKFIIDNDDENTVTMGIEVAKSVLKKANLTGKDIDMIIFSSQLPEYTFPSQALIVHGHIDGNEDALCFDTNANCVGMLYSVDNAVRYMQSNPRVNRALVIGSDYVSMHCRPDDEMTYANFGDGASAVILEKTEEDCGLIDTTFKTNSSEWGKVKYPGCGMSKIYDKKIDGLDKQIKWIPFDGSFITGYIKDSLNTLLERNNLSKEDIDALCYSQYAKSIIAGASESLEIPIDKFVYVGDRYGYTGTSSPFIALHEGIESGKIKRGDIVAFWSIGTNWTICTMLYKY